MSLDKANGMGNELGYFQMTGAGFNLSKYTVLECLKIVQYWNFGIFANY